jgi:hypothetical protein
VKITSIFVFISLLLCLAACVKLPKQTIEYSRFEKIKVAPGPEDLQLYFNKNTNQFQLFVSCDERREGVTNGSIWTIDLATNSSKPIYIKFTTQIKEFHPHGMHLYQNYLYVIDHFNELKDSRIFRFEIKGDTLMEDTLFEKGLIGFPNDLVVVGKDEFLYSNYQFKGGVVKYSKGVYSTLINKLRMPNGIDSIEINGYPFGLVSSTWGKKVYRFDTQTGEKKKIEKVKGGDNFTFNDNKLLVTGHLRFGKFFRHVKSSDHKSPSVVYELDLLSNSKKAIYVDKGKEISAVSTALYFNNRIYLGQIFDDFVLVGFVER